MTTATAGRAFDPAALDPDRDLLLAGLENMMVQYLRELLRAFRFPDLAAMEEFVERRAAAVSAPSRQAWADDWTAAAAERLRLLAADYRADRQRLYAFFAAAGEARA